MTEVINTMRHVSVFDPTDHPYPIHIIGAGATGSRIFAALIELGLTNISVYDYDIVESHNIANQIYFAGDVGFSKVDGCEEYAKRKLGVTTLPDEMQFRNCKVTKSFIEAGNLLGGIVFILTDTMASRKEIFEALHARCISHATEDTAHLNSTSLLIIETRMGSTHGSVFTFNPIDREAGQQWLSTLIDDDDTDSIELSPCGTTLSVGCTASLISNYAIWQMMQFFVDPVGLQPRIDLFFKPTLTITSQSIAA